MRQTNRWAVQALLAAALISPSGYAAADSSVRLHPLKAYTVEYRLEGQNAGTETYHLGDYGRRTATITDSTMKVFGIENRTHTRTVTEGDKVTTYDLARKTATTTTNPMHAQVAASMKGRDAQEAGMEMIRAMGFSPSGERDTIAGEACEIWTGQLGRTCFTRDAITLKVETTMAGVTIRKVATAVRRGDAGPGSAYSAEAGVKAQEQPNINDILKKMRPPKTGGG
ncbi:MAG: hypothetical protein M3O62_09275 [Pseudomonadota bacterium]|nr:hypothetical protein [Pseudomonadota bacterium]